jgi:hypothetical protein
MRSTLDLLLHRGGKYTMLEPIRLPLMEVVDEVVVTHVPGQGAGSKDWNVQHIEVTWWGQTAGTLHVHVRHLVQAVRPDHRSSACGQKPGPSPD